MLYEGFPFHQLNLTILLLHIAEIINLLRTLFCHKKSQLICLRPYCGHSKATKFVVCLIRQIFKLDFLGTEVVEAVKSDFRQDIFKLVHTRIESVVNKQLGDGNLRIV